jgi:capsular exopolysaccharide synthesis family protein
VGFYPTNLNYSPTNWIIIKIGGVEPHPTNWAETPFQRVKKMKSQKKLEKKEKRRLSDIFLNNYPAKSRFAEAFRTLRTNVHFSFMQKEFRSLLVTSASEKEGKTSTAANLAYTISQAGRSTLMIDADLRKPMLSNLGDFHESPGLTGLISNVFGTNIDRGTLGEFGVSDLITLLSLQKKTGLLQLSDGKEQVGLYFLQGKLTDIKWFTRPVEENLVNFLIKSSLLNREDAVTAINYQKDTGQKLTSILISMGLLNKNDLKGPLNLYLMESVRVAMQMKTGEYYFKSLPQSEMDRSSVDLFDIHQLYKEIAEEDEKLTYLKEKIDSAVLEVATDLYLLPSGNRPPNPSEMLGSDRMSFLISYLMKKFDVLIFDTPPILPASDAVILAPQLDGVVLMVKAGLINRDLVRKATDQLRMAKANILGVVLNRVDVKREGYYKYYNKYYSGYYGKKTY